MKSADAFCYYHKSQTPGICVDTGGLAFMVMKRLVDPFLN